jgi:hypothetical protein
VYSYELPQQQEINNYVAFADRRDPHCILLARGAAVSADRGHGVARFFPAAPRPPLASAAREAVDRDLPQRRGRRCQTARPNASLSSWSRGC